MEMYTRLLTGPVAKSNAEARAEYLRVEEESRCGFVCGAFAWGDGEGAMGSEDGFDALVCCLEMVRWQGEFAGLRATGDEAAKVGGDNLAAGG